MRSRISRIENYMLALSRSNILGFYLDTYASVYSRKRGSWRSAREQSDSKFLAKGDYDTYGMTMFTSALDISTKKNGYTYRSGSDEGASRGEQPVLRAQQLRLRHGSDGF